MIWCTVVVRQAEYSGVRVATATVRALFSSSGGGGLIAGQVVDVGGSRELLGPVADAQRHLQWRGYGAS